MTTHRVPFDGRFSIWDFPTDPPGDAPSKSELQEGLRRLQKE